MSEIKDLEESIVDLENPRSDARSGGSSSSDVTIAAELTEETEGLSDGLLDGSTGLDADAARSRRTARSNGAFNDYGHSDHPDAPLDDIAAADRVRHLAELEEEDDLPPTPRFLQDEAAWKHWKWVPYPVRRFWLAAARWSLGPPDARDFKVQGFLPAVQSAPLRLLDRVLPPSKPKSRLWRHVLFWVWLGLWLLTFSLVYRRGLVASEVGEWGTPGGIGCGNTYWVAGNQCGLDGSDCRPFNGSGFAFRCPAGCMDYQVLNPRAVGAQEIVYRPLIVGGPGSGPGGNESLYRGDSFICGAAIHAGIINNARGGCGVVQLAGRKSQFASSSANGVNSIAFDSYFPLAFNFVDNIQCVSTDMRWPLLAISVFFSTVLSLFVIEPGPFYWAIFTGLFWHIGLASDPPTHSTTSGLISDILGKFLPAALTGWVIFDKMGVRRTLGGLNAQVEKTILWLGGCWAGALNNITFDAIPIQRLTPHDLNQQPGAKAALSIIIVVLLVIVVTQVWFFRQEGRLRRYLKVYILFVSGLLLCIVIPHLNLRIHHYILALLLLPGTSMQTRPALLYQGLLVGMFMNGVARWGWASLLETPYSLQGDATKGTPLPMLLEPAIEMANVTAAAIATSVATSIAAAASAIAANSSSTITFTWQPPPGPRYDGISILVNDVERHRSYFDEGDAEGTLPLDPYTFVWHRAAGVKVNEYFRFGYMEGSRSDDYTKAGTWTEDGEWVQMAAGPSRVKSRSLDGEVMFRR